MEENKTQVSQVSSLTGFIRVIGKLKNKFLFRGESADFKSTKLTSSYCRQLKEAQENHEIEANNLILRQEMFYEVGDRLSAEERVNFIAYCQHHGLPTELLDVTENPLVALWFAAQQTGNGFVYGFQTNRVTSLYDTLWKPEIGAQNIDICRYFSVQLNRLAQHQDFEEIDFSKILVLALTTPSVAHLHNRFYWVDQLCEYILDVVKQINTEKTWKLFSRFRNKFDADDIEKNIVNFSNKNLDPKLISEFLETLIHLPQFRNFHLNDDLDSRSAQRETDMYKLLLIAFDCYDQAKLNSIEVDFPPLPYFVHKSEISFGRISAQQSLFLYQLSDSSRPGVKNWQSFDPNLVIEIHNKKDILFDLNEVGINRKFLFSDPDSIAQYLIEKHKNKYDYWFSKSSFRGTNLLN